MKNINNNKLYLIFAFIFFIVLFFIYIVINFKDDNKKIDDGIISNFGFDRRTGKITGILPYVDFKDYYRVFTNDKSNIEGSEAGEMFFSLMRYYIFGDEKYLKDDLIKNYVSCIDGKINFTDVGDDFLSKVCKGDNIFEEINFYREKDLPMKLKDIVSGNKNFDCGYFIGDNYNLPEKLKYTTMFSDYMTCLLAKSDSQNDFKQVYSQYENFLSIYNSGKCSLLEDKNLKFICVSIK